MDCKIEIGNKIYSCKLDEPIDISIPIGHKSSPKAFYAPEVSFDPLVSGDFIGSIEKGSPVNFYNIRINPHGNTTHTESALHITNKAKTINQTLEKSHYLAQLITVKPSHLANNDLVIDNDSYNWQELNASDIEALVIRTEPNEELKLKKDYSGINPPYVDSGLMANISDLVDHLLIDLPSVDKEIDGGKMISHNTFWKTDGQNAFNKTITELIYVDSSIADGLYLLEIQTIPLELDVSPSRPILYRLTEQ